MGWMFGFACSDLIVWAYVGLRDFDFFDLIVVVISGL